MDSQNHGKHTTIPEKVIKTPAEAGQTFDYVVCAHKAIDQDAAVTALTPAIDENKTTVVIIQNGVGNEEPFRNKWPKVTIITCVVSNIFDVSFKDDHSVLAKISLTTINTRHGLAQHKAHQGTSNTRRMKTCK